MFQSMLIIFVHYHDHLGVAWQDTLKPSSSARAPWASSWRSAWPAPARVLEAESAIGESPRAAIYFPTTVRILDRLGLLEEARAIGLESNEFCYHVPEHGTRIHVNTRAGLPPDEPYPYNLHFGHPTRRVENEAVMRRMAEDPANAPPATLLAEQLFGNPMPV